MTINEEGTQLTSDIYRRSEEIRKTTHYQKMLAQQRLPIHLEYLQPHLTTSETKASPLALLAATCSSIGKTDHEKKDVKTTSTILNKLTTRVEENKSSFKPYKFDIKPTIVRNSPPMLMSTSTPPYSKPVPTAVSSMFHNRFQLTMSVSETEKSRLVPLKCHTTSPPLPHIPPKVPTLSPRHHDHGECTQCKTIRPHSDPLPIINRHQPPTPVGSCPCPMCNHRSTTDSKCHYQPPTNLGALYSPPSYKGSPVPPIITCRDPNCSNCSRLPHNPLQNFLHPALIHQCTHGPLHKTPYPPPPPAHTPYDTYLKTSQKPYVCNWVADGKHCGNGFSTSEELFQHLRSHTSLQQQQQNNCDTHVAPPPQPLVTPPTHNTCNIHGCPCGISQRKSSPRSGGYSYGPNSMRYTPYSRPVTNGNSSFPGHGYVPHNIYHY